ncbi:hypothetical protein HK097_008531 [Rhizophlyctis rosea]|uniref:Uncharacterized protein n=1 Tax=Rhizophlyctis rosea TaxID=64517 RepID=A0AAD5SI80_9FUNG|nr:hypothetical protein HK097_008531 [Rhizophlyctis rosea]
MDPFKNDEEILEVDIGQRMQRLRRKGAEEFGAVGDEALEAVEMMLEKDPERRCCVEGILELEFLRE